MCAIGGTRFDHLPRGAWRRVLPMNDDRDLPLAPENNIGGHVHFLLPISWYVFSYSMFLLIVAVGAGLAFGTFTRSENVRGEVGINTIRVDARRSGTVDELLVRDNDFIEAGSPLATIRVEETVRGGTTGPNQVLKTLNDQESELRLQQRALDGAAVSAKGRLSAQAAGQRMALAALDVQIRQQVELINTSVSELQRIQAVADRGFISRRDMSARQDALLLRRQQLAALQQARADRAGELNAVKRSIEEAGSQNQASQSQIAASRAAVVRQRHEVDASRGYTLVAPASGRVAGITVDVGQPVIADQPLMSIVPYGARLYARLYVPTRAAGFMTVGQLVRLQIDAFPYSTFGAVDGRVEAISATTINRAAGSANDQEAFYVVTCSMSRPFIKAFNHFESLKPGMTLKARIIIRETSLLEWLFEPIYAVSKR